MKPKKTIKSYLLELSDESTYLYKLVRSKRAKYIRIKLANNGQLSVVVPQGISAKKAHHFMQSKVDWIEKHLQSLPEIEQASDVTSIQLTLLNQAWAVDYELLDGETIEYSERADKRLHISGNINDKELVNKVILLWLKNKAREPFTFMLNQIAEEHGFHYQRLSIRAQKTRWGSCSSKKNINLNCKLLLMPEHVVTYVMIHELCHTLEMNHSHRFWALVKDCYPQYKKSQRVLKQLERDVMIF